MPDRPLEERIKRVLAVETVDAVVAGDAEKSRWEVLLENPPDVIALGYDQAALREDLALYLERLPTKPKIVVMHPYQPDVYHTSLLRGEGARDRSEPPATS